MPCRGSPAEAWHNEQMLEELSVGRPVHKHAVEIEELNYVFRCKEAMSDDVYLPTPEHLSGSGMSNPS